MRNLEQLCKEWQELQPLKPEDAKRLDDKFKLEFNYNSNHIEGNTLTYGQTSLLLDFDDIVDGAKMRDCEEMKAHNVGLKWIRELARENDLPLKEIDIKNLNKIILVEDFYKINTSDNSRYKINVGNYKSRPNSVQTLTGEIFDYASLEETPAMMYDLIKWLNEEITKIVENDKSVKGDKIVENDNNLKGDVDKERFVVRKSLSPIELAALLHYRYIRIHPFEDGNGRIARLLVTYILEKFGLPMIIIKSEDKEKYLRALNQCDDLVGKIPYDGANALLEKIEPFVKYLKGELVKSLEIALKAAKGESIIEEEDWKKKLKIRFKDKIAAPERSKEFEEKVLKECEDLVIKIDEELKEFYSIFESVAVEKVIEVSNILICCYLLLINGRTILGINILLSQFKYKIVLKKDGYGNDVMCRPIESAYRYLFRTEHRYDESLTEEEKRKIINTIGEELERIARKS